MTRPTRIMAIVKMMAPSLAKGSPEIVRCVAQELGITCVYSVAVIESWLCPRAAMMTLERKELFTLGFAV
jgi:hypothetical protein